MSDDEPPFDLPAIPQSIDPAVRNPMVRMREAIQTLLGLRGDGSNAAFTARRYGAGLLDGLTGSTTNIIAGGGSGGVYTPDLTPPPTATGLAIVAGFTEVIVSWDAATYTQGHGHGQTNIYAVKKASTDATLPTFGSAARVYSATGALTIAALPSELNTRWHVWIKWQSADGVESAAPAGGANGVSATTGQDIVQLLNVLSGSITASQLYSALGARIDLIDGVGAGSVNARISTETTARANADSALSASISTVSASTATNAVAISTEATARAGADGLLFAQYTVKLDVNGYVSGYGIASTSTGAAPFSTFIIRADSFSIAAPSGPGIATIMPFVVRSTVTIESGVSIPIGVYMDSAYIVNLSAMYARMGTLVADSISVGQINAANLTLGSGAIGGNLRSTNYVAGVSGWLVQPNGNAEFSFAHIRGTLAAGQIAAGYVTAGMIDSRGLSIKDAAGNVILAAGTGLDFNARFAVGTANLPTSDLSLVNGTGNANTIVGNAIYRAAITAAWLAADCAFSREALSGGAYCSFTVPNGATAYFIAGLTNDKTLGAADNPATGQYGFIIREDSAIGLRYGGAEAAGGTWVVGDVLAISYDGVNVRFLRNGVVLATSAITGLSLSFFASLLRTGTTPALSNIRFGPMSSNNWADFGGSGKPADNATVGATIGVNLGGQITAANASTFIAAAAITNALIGDTIQSDNFVAGSIGWRIQKSTGTIEVRNVIARGDITANQVTVGASPAVSGTTMTGAGAVINSGGTFAIGNAAGNIAYNGTTLTLNGTVVATGNIQLAAVGTGQVANAAIGTAQVANNAIISTVASSNVGAGRFAGSGIVSRTETLNVGSIVTDANGSGRVMILLAGTAFPALSPQPFLMEASWGPSVSNTVTFDIMRNAVSVWNQTFTQGPSGTVYCNPTMALDTPGPGVSCAYSLRIVITSAATNSMACQITSNNCALLEVKR